MRLEDLFAGQPVDIPAILARLKRVAAELGLAFGERTMTYNSRLAQELGKWAETQNRGDAFHHAMFVAYFAHGKNIAQRPVLLEACREAGLDPESADPVIEKRLFQAAVDDDWQRSRQLGISVVPTFVINGKRLVGAQPFSALERLVLSAGVKRRENARQA